MVLNISQKSYDDIANYAAENAMTVTQAINFMLRTRPTFYMEDLQILMLSRNNPTENLLINFPEYSKEIEEFDQTLSSFWFFYYKKRKERLQKEKRRKRKIHEGCIEIKITQLKKEDEEKAKRIIALHLSARNIRDGEEEIKEATEFLRNKKEEIQSNPENLKECREFLMGLM